MFASEFLRELKENEMNKFAWSSDGNYFVGSFDSSEAALADALSGLKGEYEFTVGELVPAIEYLSYKKIGGNILEEIFDQLSGEIDSDIVERSFEWTEKDEEELGKIVLDYIDRHIGFNCFGIKNERVIQGIA